MVDLHANVNGVHISHSGVVVDIDWTILRAYGEGHSDEAYVHEDIDVAGSPVTNALITAAIKASADTLARKYFSQRWHGASDAMPTWDSQYETMPLEYVNDHWTASTVTMSITVASPSPWPLVFTMFRPVVTNGKIRWCAPAKKTITFTMATPTIRTPRTCSPPTQSIRLTMGQPVIYTKPTPRPSTRALTFSMGTPVVTAS